MYDWEETKWSLITLAVMAGYVAAPFLVFYLFLSAIGLTF